MFANISICSSILLVVLVNLIVVEGAEDPKWLEDFYTNCARPNTGIFSSSKICSGLFGVDCISKKICEFGAYVSENETHFNIVMMESRPEGKENENAWYSSAASISPFHTLPQTESESPKCKRALSLRDFQFRYFKETIPNKGIKSDGTTAGVVAKADWANQCEELRKDYLDKSNSPDLQMKVSNQYFAPLFAIQSPSARKNPDFSDGTKYNTTDNFIYTNFDRNCGTGILSSSSSAAFISTIMFSYYYVLTFQ